MIQIPCGTCFIGDAYPDLLKWVSGDSKHVQWYKSKNTLISGFIPENNNNLKSSVK